MPTGYGDVRFRGKTGSLRPTVKTTRMTHNGPPSRLRWVLFGSQALVSFCALSLFKPCCPKLILRASWIVYGRRRSLIADEKMSSTVFQIASVAAGLAVLAADCAVFLLPLGKMKDLARGLAITVSLGLIAAFLLAAARNFDP
jgi:hypothetical protein